MLPHESDPPSWLLGRWRLLRADAGLQFAPGTRMDFRDGGELHYTIPTDGRDFEVELIYRVVGGDVLLTENRSNPHSAATHFELGPGDVLVFDFAGARALFVRETE